VGHDKICHLFFHYGRFVWRPTKRMQAAGFRRAPLGPGVVVDGKNVPASADIARATELNQAWDRHRRGLTPAGPGLRYRSGTVGEGYQRALALRSFSRIAMARWYPSAVADRVAAGRWWPVRRDGRRCRFRRCLCRAALPP
jgi:hypothetical protein